MNIRHRHPHTLTHTLNLTHPHNLTPSTHLHFFLFSICIKKTLCQMKILDHVNFCLRLAFTMLYSLWLSIIFSPRSVYFRCFNTLFLASTFLGRYKHKQYIFFHLLAITSKTANKTKILCRFVVLTHLMS